jgi:hypothetical protein
MKSSPVRALCGALVLAVGSTTALAQMIGSDWRVNQDTTGNQTRIALAAISNVHYIVVWGDNDEDGRGVYGRRVNPAGIPVSNPFRVNTTTTGDQTYPQVASDVAGNFVVVWRLGTGGIFAQRYSFLGTPLGVEFRVDDSSPGGADPDVAREPDGDFIVVWTAGDGEVRGMWARRYTSAGAPAAAPFRVNTYTTGDQTSPSIAASANGFVIVWGSAERADDHFSGTYGQRYLSTGAPAGVEFHVNAHTPSADDEPSVAMRSNGDFVVVWRDYQDGAQASVTGQRYSSTGAPQGGEFGVNTHTTGAQTEAHVRYDSPSTFMVAWVNQDLSDVSGRRFLSSGAPITGEFRVNQATAFQVIGPRIASPVAENGRFMAGWWAPDGAQYGVFVRAGCLMGDADGNGTVNVLDVFFIINLLFANGSAPFGCADANNSGLIDVLDVFFLISYLFAGGPAPG